MSVNTRGIVRLMLLAHLAPVGLCAQQAARPDSARRDTLEAVVVRALRGPGAPAVAQHVVTRDRIAATFTGEDAPLFLSRTPSVTAYSESGGWSGYSYLRVRGIDQTRLNITLDGVPLNDPEDQVLYFSNVPDFLASIASVQVQRGAGPSTFGTAPYGGALNFQSIPIATTPRGGAAELTAGSFNTARASVQYSTGLGAAGWAAYARLTKQHTDGYRHHSGNDAHSAFASAGWFGTRHAVKVTGLAGVSGTRLAYLAAAETDLALDRRTNPLGDNEGDRFHQEMVSVQYTTALGDRATFSSTAYRNSAAGAFDVNFGNAPGGGPVIGNFFLGHVWHGALAALSWRSGGLTTDVGAHVSDYHREHAMAIRPDLETREYDNTGFKQEQSAFAKAAIEVGRARSLRLAADVQVRRAAFRYEPSPNAGIDGASTSWTFVNPRLGVSWEAGALRPGLAPLSLHAWVGRTSREPARGDLLAGADDLNSSNAADLLPLSRVRPEQVTDVEAGMSWTGKAVTLGVNVFAMEFRDEIAPIGALSLTGNPLRQNVAESYRRGVEVEARWEGGDRIRATGNLTLMRSRIASFTDARSGRTFVNVEPLMTPSVTANAEVEWRLGSRLSAITGARHVGRAFLANDGGLQLSPQTLVDATIAWRAGRATLRLQVNNVLDADSYAGGYHDGTNRYLYPVATRNFLFTTRLGF